jgi:hypothetical protein
LPAQVKVAVNRLYLTAQLQKDAQQCDTVGSAGQGNKVFALVIH